MCGWIQKLKSFLSLKNSLMSSEMLSGYFCSHNATGIKHFLEHATVQNILSSQYFCFALCRRGVAKISVTFSRGCEALVEELTFYTSGSVISRALAAFTHFCCLDIDFVS